MKRHFLLTTCLTLMAGAVHAGTVQVDLTTPSQTGNPGDTLAFFATITNLSATDTIYFNGASATAASPFLSIDITPYLLDAPLFLAPEQTSSLFEFVDVTIDPTTLPGPYTGNVVSVLGGADGGAFTAFEDLADPTFDVIVNSTSTGAPEPGTGAMILAALGLLAGGNVRRSTPSFK